MDVIVKMNRRRRKSRSRSRPRIKRKSRRRSRPKKRKSVSRRSSPRISFTSVGNRLMNMIVPFSQPIIRRRSRSRSNPRPRIKRKSRQRSRPKRNYSVRIVDFNTDSPPSSTTSSSNTSLTTSTITSACTSACTTSQANTPTTPQQTSTINMNELRKAINEIKSQEDIDECPICLDEITNSDRFDVKCCKLKIHHTCFNNLVEHQNNDKCPQCRQNMTS